MNRISLAACLVLLLLPACAHSRSSPRATLSADSAAVLRRAIQLARPAYPTQREAVRSGVYRQEPERFPERWPERLPERVPEPVAPPDAPLPPTRFFVQLAAFRDPVAAELAARDARLTFPGLAVVVELDAGWHRVALNGWSTAAEAEARLPEIRRLFPGAWVRPHGAP